MMQTTPKGNISSKVAPGRTGRRRLLIQQIARMTLMGLQDDQIALALQCTKVYVSMNRRTPEYMAIWTELSTGVISRLDSDLRATTESFTEEIKSMVPTALLALNDALHDKSQARIRFEAAKQILDREGTTAVVSKSQVTHKAEIDFAQHEETADDLLAALSAMRAGDSTEKPQPLPGSDVFKNSSLSKSQQAEMYEQINIADFDIPKDRAVQ